MKNNKGQVLVLFVILIPIIILLLLITIEIGNIYLEKIKTKNIIKEIITDNLNNYDEKSNERINILIEKNIDNIKTKEIFTSEDEIRIILKQNETLFGRNIEIEYKTIGTKKENIVEIKEG